MKTRSMARVIVLVGATAIAGAVACRAEDPGSTFEVPPGAKPPPGTGDGAGGDTGGPAQPAQPTQAEMLATFTPAEVMDIALVIHLGEVTQGELAWQRATNPDVKAFAVRMVDEHGQALQRLQRLSGTAMTAQTTQARVANDVTSSLLQREQELLASDLKTQKGASFDLAYMTGQISAHAKALALVDRALLPSISPGQAPAPMLATRQHAHPVLAAGGQVTGGAGGSEAAPAMPEVPDLGALQTELQTMRTRIAGHLAEALWLQRTLRTSEGAAPAATGAARPGA